MGVMMHLYIKFMGEEFIGVSMSEPLPSAVNVDFVCLSWTSARMAWQWRMSLIFLHVAVYVTMSEPLPSAVNMDFVCLSWTGVRIWHGNGT